MVELLSPATAPAPRGPYSPAVRCGDFLFVSGQGPIDPRTNQLVDGGIAEQTRQTLENLKAILEGCGASLKDVVRCTVYITSPEDFGEMNRVYAEFFGDHKPARTTAVTQLVLPGMKVEIDCVAYVPKGS